jgi:hypothetical protein
VTTIGASSAASCTCSGQRRKRGEQEQAIGRSRGGRTARIHALSDPDCRPCAFHLTPGQDADIAAAPALLTIAPPMAALIADKDYDGDDFRADIVNRGAKSVIPNLPTVRCKNRT